MMRTPSPSRGGAGSVQAPHDASSPLPSSFLSVAAASLPTQRSAVASSSSFAFPTPDPAAAKILTACRIVPLVNAIDDSFLFKESLLATPTTPQDSAAESEPPFRLAWEVNSEGCIEDISLVPPAFDAAATKILATTVSNAASVTPSVGARGATPPPASSGLTGAEMNAMMTTGRVKFSFDGCVQQTPLLGRQVPYLFGLPSPSLTAPRGVVTGPHEQDRPASPTQSRTRRGSTALLQRRRSSDASAATLADKDGQQHHAAGRRTSTSGGKDLLHHDAADLPGAASTSVADATGKPTALADVAKSDESSRTTNGPPPTVPDRLSVKERESVTRLASHAMRQVLSGFNVTIVSLGAAETGKSRFFFNAPQVNDPTLCDAVAGASPTALQQFARGTAPNVPPLGVAFEFAKQLFDSFRGDKAAARGKATPPAVLITFVELFNEEFSDLTSIAAAVPPAVLERTTPVARVSVPTPAQAPLPPPLPVATAKRRTSSFTAANASDTPSPAHSSVGGRSALRKSPGASPRGGVSFRDGVGPRATAAASADGVIVLPDPLKLVSSTVEIPSVSSDDDDMAAAGNASGTKRTNEWNEAKSCGLALSDSIRSVWGKCARKSADQIAKQLAPALSGLRLRQSADLGVVVDGASTVTVSSYEEFVTAVGQGCRRRLHGDIRTNKYSHVVLQITVRQSDVALPKSKVASLCLVDSAPPAVRLPQGMLNKAKKMQTGANALRKVLQLLNERSASTQPSASSPASSPVSRRRSAQPPQEGGPAPSSTAAAPNVYCPASLIVPSPSLDPLSLQTFSTNAACHTAAKESVLTHFLEESLLGNAQLVVVANIVDTDVPVAERPALGWGPANPACTNAFLSLSSYCAQQNLSTLKVVSKLGPVCKKVVLCEVKNDIAAGALRNEIQALKQALEKGTIGTSADGASEDAMEKVQRTCQLASYEAQLLALQDQLSQRAATQAEIEERRAKQVAALDAARSHLEEKLLAQRTAAALVEELDAVAQSQRLAHQRMAAEAQAAARKQEEIAAADAELQRIARRRLELDAGREAAEAKIKDDRQRQAASVFRAMLEASKHLRELRSCEDKKRRLRGASGVLRVKTNSKNAQVEQLRNDLRFLELQRVALDERLASLIADRSPQVADQHASQIAAGNVTTRQHIDAVRADMRDVDARLTLVETELAAEHSAVRKQLADAQKRRDAEIQKLSTAGRKIDEVTDLLRRQSDTTKQREKDNERQLNDVIALRGASAELDGFVVEAKQEISAVDDECGTVLAQGDEADGALRQLREEAAFGLHERQLVAAKYSDLCRLTSSKLTPVTAVALPTTELRTYELR